MENKYLIGVGLLVLGVFAYSRYNKKDESGENTDQGSGGGIGGGGFGGALVIPPINQPSVPIVPKTTTQVTGGIKPTIITNPNILSGLGAGKPTAATTSSTGAGATSTASNTGITGIGGTTGQTTQTSPGATMTGTAGGTVFKPFSGGELNGKTPIYLNDLVRSWNRP